MGDKLIDKYGQKMSEKKKLQEKLKKANKVRLIRLAEAENKARTFVEPEVMALRRENKFKGLKRNRKDRRSSILKERRSGKVIVGKEPAASKRNTREWLKKQGSDRFDIEYSPKESIQLRRELWAQNPSAGRPKRKKCRRVRK